MALEAQSALSTLFDALNATDDGQLMRRILQGALQALIDAEATAHIGVGPHERAAARTTHRNGTRDRLVATTAGDLNIKIPKTRMARSSRPCCTHAAASTALCMRW